MYSCFPAHLALASLLVGGCATAAPPEPERVRVGADGACDATGVQASIGAMATQDLGARLLAGTGARSLRWVPPRTAVTMDFRPDRLTVAYDDDMKITRIGCG